MKKIISLLLPVFAACAAFAEIKILEPAPGAVVPLLTDSQKAYVTMDRQARREKFADPAFRRSTMGLPAEKVPGESKQREAYWPKTVRLAWEAKDGEKYFVRVSHVEKGLVAAVTIKGGELYIDNLEIAASYEWKVEGGR